MINFSDQTKKKLIVLLVLFLVGVGTLLFGIFGKLPCTDVFVLTDSDIGKNVTVEVLGPLPIDDHNYILYFEDSNGKPTEIRMALNDTLAREYQRYLEASVTLTGILRSETEEMRAACYQAEVDYVHYMETIIEDYTVTDEDIAKINESLSSYYIEATALNEGLFPLLKKIAFIAGCIMIAASVIVLISVVSKKNILKIALIFLIVIAVPAVIVSILFFNKIRTLCSIRSDAPGVYFMEYAGDYKVDDMLNANIRSDQDLLEWIRKSEFCGIPIEYDLGRFGCSSFKANTPDGEVLFGRNFDYPETDTLMIYSAPKDGYASYSIADLEVLGIGVGYGKTDPDSIPGRIMMLAAPYVACDGVNEAGLGVSTLELSIGEIHQDTGKPDLYVYTAIRVILDKCATVDEALTLLDSYDIHSHYNVRQHLFIVDKSGRSVVVEWFDDQMYVNELDAVTNSVVTPGEHYDECADWRLPVITAGLSEHSGILTKEQARDLLEAAAQKDYTEWSCVYDLNDFSVDLYVDEDYGHAYHYGGKR